MVTLIVQDNGKSIHQLGDSGSKVIQASGNTGSLTLVLRASISGRIEERSCTVKVKRKILKAEIPRSKKMNFGKVSNWWERFSATFKRTWSYMPENKRLAYIVLGLIFLSMLLISVSPKLMPLGFIAIVGYLTWVIFKS